MSVVSFRHFLCAVAAALAFVAGASAQPAAPMSSSSRPIPPTRRPLPSTRRWASRRRFYISTSRWTESAAYRLVIPHPLSTTRVIIAAAVSRNDTLRLFDVMRVAALIHGASGPDYSRRLTAAVILRAATIDGARTAMLEGETGSLEVGKKADLIVLKTDRLTFTPMNDVVKHLVYGENGSSLELAMVNGEIVLSDGRLTRIDEDQILREVRELVPAYLAEHAAIEERNRVFEPYFAEIHRRATRQEIGLNRYAGDMPAWPGTNLG